MMPFSDHLCFKVYAVSRYITSLYKPHLETLSLTYPQYLVLVVLWEFGSMSISGIGEHLQLDNATLTSLLKRMETNGLLFRLRSTTDERVVRISLTEDGLALKEKAAYIPEAVKHCINLEEHVRTEIMQGFDEILSVAVKDKASLK